MATDTSASGGHGISDENGNVMPQRNMVQFVNLTVEDIPGDGATRITNSNWVRTYNGITGTISANNWIDVSPFPWYSEEDGVYRVSCLIELNNITTIGREIGFRVVNQPHED